MPTRPVKRVYEGFREMRDTVALVSNEPTVVQYADNLILTASGEYRTRPGMKATLTTPAAIAGSGEPQVVGTLTSLTGVHTTFCVVAGEIYVYNPPTTSTWASTVTTANFATASITRTTTGRWRYTTSSGKVVFSDGTNPPFTWDGTAGAGGLVSLSNCPALYGPPVIYYGKLFGIKASDRAAIVWSEEYALNTGYEAGGYNNAWTLQQTGTNPLQRLVPTNRGLYYWRTRGIGLIVGAITPDFVTTGVHDAISPDVGTQSPDAFAIIGESTVFFLDTDALPMLLDGDGLRPIWRAIERQRYGPSYGAYGQVTTLLTLLQSVIPATSLVHDAVYDPQSQIVWLFYTGMSVLVGVGYTLDGRAVGYWYNAIDHSLVAPVTFTLSTGVVVQTVMFVSASRYATYADHTRTFDSNNGTDTAISQNLVLSAVEDEVVTEFRWERADLDCYVSSLTGTPTVGAKHFTSAAPPTSAGGGSTAQTINADATGYNKLEWGWDAVGRWIFPRFIFTGTTTGPEFRIRRAEVSGYAWGADVVAK